MKQRMLCLINVRNETKQNKTRTTIVSLSFFEKLILCRGLHFAIPQQTSPRDIQGSFEKAYWKLEPLILSDSKKDLACASLRSIALNYIASRDPKPPKALLQAVNNLKRREDIIITKPDKGSGVVVMDKTDYLRLLCDASICDSTKFTECSNERPKTRARPPKHYHPLLENENELYTKVHNTLPKSIVDSLCPKGSRLVHLYGLPKTHKPELSMRPILSATKTYNYALAKWLEEKLKPLSTNAYLINDIFQFSEDIRNMPVDADHILASYDVTALFTNVPAHETIGMHAEKAFAGNWFNNTCNLNLTKDQIMQLLKLATINQLFQLGGILYEQVESVAMGSPLGPLLANTFMCSIEVKLDERNELPSFYKRYVDDAFKIMPGLNLGSTVFLIIY